MSLYRIYVCTYDTHHVIKVDYTWYALKIDILLIWTNSRDINESFQNESVCVYVESKRLW